MKILTQEEIDAHYNVTIRGGIKGTLLGLGLALPGSWLLHRRWTYYRQLPVTLKALAVVTIVAPACVIEAERAGLRFERAQWKGVGKEELEAREAQLKLHWDSLNSKDKIRDWADRHKFGIIGGSWATSMVTAWLIIQRNPYQTFSQKIVQARMWAQGLTLGVVIASAALSNTGSKHHAPPPSSWRAIIQDEEIAQRQRELRAADQVKNAP